jgi:exodeoxyribonuclease-3
MKIASWNVNSLKVRLPHLADFVAAERPDVLVLQETKSEDAAFPVDDVLALGYRPTFAGQRAYNGVAILARTPPRDVVTELPGVEDPERRLLAATVDGVRVVDVYVVNGQAVGTDKYRWKLRWLDAVRDFLADELTRHPALVVLGDFNIAPDDRDVYDPEGWREQILCSTPERAALRRLFDLGLHDSFRLFEDAGGHYSWWDYRAGAFERNKGLRIDLALVSDALKARCRAAGIVRTPRSWDRPSDHAPVWVTVS